MAAIYHPNVVTIVPQYNIGAPHTVANVLHFMGQNSPWTLPQLTGIQATFDAAWGNFWSAMASTADKYNGSVVTDSGSNTGLQVQNSTFPPVTGTASGGPVADNVALLLSLHSNLRYKGGHPRLYIPGMALSAANGDGRTWTAGTLTNASSGWTNVINAMNGITTTNGGPFTLIVWHKKLAGQLNTTSPILSMTPQSVFATQRRRLRKVARH